MMPGNSGWTLNMSVPCCGALCFLSKCGHDKDEHGQQQEHLDLLHSSDLLQFSNFVAPKIGISSISLVTEARPYQNQWAAFSSLSVSCTPLRISARRFSVSDHDDRGAL